MKRTQFRSFSLLLALAAALMLAVIPARSGASNGAAVSLADALTIVQEQHKELQPAGISLESENGKTFYSVEMLAADGTVQEFRVDAASGAVVDEPVQPAAEQAADGENSLDAGEDHQDEVNAADVSQNGGNNAENEGGQENQGELDAGEKADEALLFSTVKVSLLQAVQTAMATVPGAEVREAGLENENGTAVYMVTLLSANGVKSEAAVDALTGSLIQFPGENAEHAD